ncbi:MAG TPA: threonine synthase [Anaerolineaceae bacterium]|nr:threonine synthase [Anaerolineaceae bacterium]
MISYYECSLCHHQWQPNQVLYTCPDDGGNLNTILDFNGVKPSDILNSPEASLWRYTPLLPVGNPGYQLTPLHQVGLTPVYQPAALREKLGLKHLFIKDESRNPSASFKDRASAIVVARALETKVKTIVAASTGNAGAAMACMSAAVGLPAIILAPKTAPPAKLAQLLVFGAKVILVDGNYDQAFDLSLAASREFGWYNRNTGFNPFTVEGKKTAGFEIWEQVLLHLHSHQRLTVFISVGDGNILSGVYKGFKDLLSLGWLERMPRIIGVQAEGSAAVANAFFSGSDQITPVRSTTVADSISVDLPRDGLRALHAVRQSEGFMLTVSDSEILAAIPELGRAGIFAEPAASTAYAGLVKAVSEKLFDPSEPVLVLSTGSGLKDIKAAAQSVIPAPVIEPTLQSLRKVIHV